MAPPSKYFLLYALTLLAFDLSLTGAEAIAPERFTKLHQLIKPGKDENQWEQIPWLTSLWEARAKAAVQGKPLVLWEMDGHPLGCT